MSTPTVRTAIMSEINTLTSLEVLNLSDWLNLSDLPVNDDEQIILVDFVASSERVTTIGGFDNLGFVETGTVAIHWLCPTGFDSDPILASAEALRLSLRGRRIAQIIVESVEPFQDSGSPVDIDGRWTAYSALLSYSLNSCV